MKQQPQKLTVEQITTILTKAFQPSKLEVIDDEALHASHAHAGAGHFRIIINSPDFKNKNRIETHRMIYAVLEPFINNGIHALMIHAKA